MGLARHLMVLDAYVVGDMVHCVVVEMHDR